MKNMMKRFAVCLVLVVMVSLVIIPAQAVKVYDTSAYGGGGKAPTAYSENRATYNARAKKTAATLPATVGLIFLDAPKSAVDVLVQALKQICINDLKSKNAY